jgi:hypothetical protein
MKVNVIDNTDKDVVTMDQMRPNDVGVIVSNMYKGTVVMRTANQETFEVMNLSNPNPDGYWNERASHKVRLASKVELTVEFG